MAMNNTNFAFGMILAENEGVDRARAVQLGLVASLMGSSILPAVVVQQMARNEVAATTPAPVTPVRPPSGGTGTLTQAQVPDVSAGAQTFAAAERILKNLQFRVARKDVLSAAKAGIVVAQQPKAGEVVPVGSTVTLSVSRTAPPEYAKVPETTGKARADAEKLVTDAKFRFKLVFDLDAADAPNDGKVVAQDPLPNAQHEVGEIVTLTIRTVKAP